MKRATLHVVVPEPEPVKDERVGLLNPKFKYTPIRQDRHCQDVRPHQERTRTEGEASMNCTQQCNQGRGCSCEDQPLVTPEDAEAWPEMLILCICLIALVVWGFFQIAPVAVYAVML